MKLLRFLSISLVFASSFPAGLTAQVRLTMADAIAKGRTALAPSSLRQLQWIPNSGQFTYTSGKKVVRVQAGSLAVDTLDLLPALNADLGKLGVKKLDEVPAFNWVDGDKFWFQTNREAVVSSLTGGVQRVASFPAEATGVDVHVKSMNLAYLLNDELWVVSGNNDALVAKSESPGIKHGASVHRDEFGITKGTFWSNNGQKLAFYRMDEHMVTEYPVYVLDSMPAQAKMLRYPFAGAPSHHVTIGVYDVATGKSLYLNTGLPAEQYLTNIAWSPDDRYLLVAILNREQNHLWMRVFDAATGNAVSTLFEETDEKYVEPEKPARFVVGRADQFVWESERDGFNNLYLYDLKGTLIRQLTKGDSPVIQVYGFSPDGKKVFYQSADKTGLNRYLYATEVATGKTVNLTPEEGTHNGLVSSGGDWLLDIFTNLVTPRQVWAVPVGNPTQRKQVYAAKNPVEGYAVGQVKLVEFLSPSGVKLNGRLVLPYDFDSTRRYPVLVNVYNGPHIQMVTNSWLGGSELWMHRLAQEGMVVFSMDGRGSANRGNDFESAIFRHIGDAEVADQLEGVRFLKSQPYVDSNRLGVYGWSYGGFMATSLMTRPEAKGVFRCGIAGGAVIDWKMYEVMYTERYMDTPAENPAGYEKANLLRYVDNLQAPFLMIHGSSDDVVLWQHTLNYIRECVRKGKQVDYFVYPEHFHNVLGKDRVHLFEKIEDFVEKNLQVKRP